MRTLEQAKMPTLKDKTLGVEKHLVKPFKKRSTVRKVVAAVKKVVKKK